MLLLLVLGMLGMLEVLVVLVVLVVLKELVVFVGGIFKHVISQKKSCENFIESKKNFFGTIFFLNP